MVVIAALVNIVGSTGHRRPGVLLAVAAADNLLQVADHRRRRGRTSSTPSALTAELDLFSSPGAEDILFAITVSMLALAGIEAASDLAPDLDWEPGDLRKVVRAGAWAVPLIYVGMATVALMAVPVVAGPIRAGDGTGDDLRGGARCSGSPSRSSRSGSARG